MTDLNEEVREIWNRNAAFWDAHMADGNDFQRELVAPATERLLELHGGEDILEIAGGNGVMARRLVELGAHILATDFSEDMIEHARKRGDFAGKIQFMVLDATDPAQLEGLGRNRFDAIVCNMALMDMAAIDPLMQAVPSLLTDGGRFVFSLCHPCFNSSGCTRMVEETDDGEIQRLHSVKVWKYRTLGVAKGLAMRGQPTAQYYFNRTLAQVFGACFAAGLVVDGLEEPTFERNDESSFVHWNLFAEMPPVVTVRVRMG